MPVQLLHPSHTADPAPLLRFSDLAQWRARAVSSENALALMAESMASASIVRCL